ncbi:aTPase/histidine kinase/DNA gyrase B/HSP90 domain protein [Clostridium sp. CAG:571]|jgi:signal transduction histidine kinase|nr:aTPase/histidine kinase/DNA gyrase B/HSP90 domain protein [Clostridium sp. CAG:571]
MKLIKYLLDKIPQIIISIMGFAITIFMLNAFKVESTLKIAITIIFFIVCTFNIGIDYFRKYKFYQSLSNTLDVLDKKYLILEMINKPNFYEGEIFYQTLYDINKSMIENVKEYNLSIIDFKEYVEMWIHEVKIPISSLTLLIHNNQEKIDKRYVEQIRKLDNYIDQILYYVRSENAEKDYIIKEKSLQEIIKNVALKNKDDLLASKVKLDVNVNNIKVLTDAKWLEFILNQIINNSIKYKRNNVESYIKIIAKEDKEKTYLSIYDNGIGIPKKDIPRVFEKSFTGENGRIIAKSTGMGLYIVKKLCDKLGHKINIESKKKEYTKITIIFYKNDFYKIKD